LPILKQVILIRRDLKMRRGKEIAQGSHASMEFLTSRLRGGAGLTLSITERQWMENGMAKVCLQVGSEEELVSLFEKARAAGLEAHLVRDSGRTEFGGVPTLTALAIGPADAAAIDAVTGHLALY
jgi:PTH2 family peptidyl-tRNA hydrolase